MKTINLEEILWKSFYNNNIPKPTHTLAEITQKAVKEAMKEACRQTIELAAENAEIEMNKKSQYGKYRKWQKVKDKEEVDLFSYEVKYLVNRQSILNTINQIH